MSWRRNGKGCLKGLRKRHSKEAFRGKYEINVEGSKGEEKKRLEAAMECQKAISGEGKGTQRNVRKEVGRKLLTAIEKGDISCEEKRLAMKIKKEGRELQGRNPGRGDGFQRMAFTRKENFGRKKLWIKNKRHEEAISRADDA